MTETRADEVGELLAGLKALPLVDSADIDQSFAAYDAFELDAQFHGGPSGYRGIARPPRWEQAVRERPCREAGLRSGHVRAHRLR